MTVLRKRTVSGCCPRISARTLPFRKHSNEQPQRRTELSQLCDSRCGHVPAVDVLLPEHVRPQPDQLPYSAFITAVDQGEIRSATIQGQEVIAERSAGGTVTTYVPQGAGLIAQLQQKGVVIKAEPPPQPSLLGSLLLSLLPFALMIGIVVWMSRRAMGQQGGGGLMSIGKSKAKLLHRSAWPRDL